MRTKEGAKQKQQGYKENIADGWEACELKKFRVGEEVRAWVLAWTLKYINILVVLTEEPGGQHALWCSNR